MPRNAVRTASPGRVAQLDGAPASETGVLSASSRFWAKVTKGDGCWLWTGAVTSSGYGSFGLITSPKPRMVSAHKLSWQWAHGAEVPAGMVVMHSCDNRLCVRPDHLSLGTVEENNRDMADRGRARQPAVAVCARCGGIGHGRRLCRTGESSGISRAVHDELHRLASEVVAGRLPLAEAEALTRKLVRL